jgi:ubiquinone/menaquinone biosynthesis C-methylase UbiE
MKSRLARGYSRTAPLYDALAGPLYANGIRRLLPRLQVPPTPAVLDVGCGTGVNLVEAARSFSPTRLLCGIDISPGMAEVARAKMAQLGLPAQITVGDAESLPYPDRTFDLVICNSVLHWFRDRGAALREMARVLRPGGQVALICAAAPGFREWFGIIDGLLQAALGPSTPKSAPELPTASEVNGLMQAAGFAINHLANPIQMQPVFHPESFIRLMSTVAPSWAADLPPDAQAKLEQMAAGIMRMWPGGFPNTWSAIEAIGTRVR